MNFRDCEYVIFDLETTGLNPCSDYIIELAAIRVDGYGNIINTMEALIKLPDMMEIPDHISKITHIDNNLLQNQGQDVDEILNQFYEFCQDVVIVGQNVLFDMRFVINYFLHNKQCFAPIYLDLINITKFINPHLDSYKLINLVNYYQISFDQDQFHRAMYDVVQTKNCFFKALDYLEAQHFSTIEQLCSISKWENITGKQQNLLTSLIDQHHLFTADNHYFSKALASFHIKILLEDGQ